jgi:hypothetical protein
MILYDLKSCQHTNPQPHRYIREDSLMSTGTKVYQELCIMCGSHRRHFEGQEPEPWLAPWIWRTAPPKKKARK